MCNGAVGPMELGGKRFFGDILKKTLQRLPASSQPNTTAESGMYHIVFWLSL